MSNRFPLTNYSVMLTQNYKALFTGQRVGKFGIIQAEAKGSHCHSL